MGREVGIMEQGRDGRVQKRHGEVRQQEIMLGLLLNHSCILHEYLGTRAGRRDTVINANLTGKLRSIRLPCLRVPKSTENDVLPKWRYRMLSVGQSVARPRWPPLRRWTFRLNLCPTTESVGRFLFSVLFYCYLHGSLERSLDGGTPPASISFVSTLSKLSLDRKMTQFSRLQLAAALIGRHITRLLLISLVRAQPISFHRS